MPSLGVNSFEFLQDENFVILARVVFTQCQRVTDGQMDGQTDGMPTIASTWLAATQTPCKNVLEVVTCKIKLVTCKIKHFYNIFTSTA